MITKEEQEAINQACKYHPETYRELSILINDPKVNLGEIDTSKITDMSNLFAFKYRERTDFSGIEKWDMSNVEKMSYMFAGCQSFNQDISNWNVSSVKNMEFMFQCCDNFNQPLNDWNVGNVEDMYGMFCICTNFNQPLNNWDVGNVYCLNEMFYDCRAFNQSLNDWCVREDCYTDYIFEKTAQSYENVNKAFTQDQLQVCGSEKIIKALNNEKEQKQETKKVKGAHL